VCLGLPKSPPYGCYTLCVSSFPRQTFHGPRRLNTEYHCLETATPAIRYYHFFFAYDALALPINPLLTNIRSLTSNLHLALLSLGPHCTFRSLADPFRSPQTICELITRRDRTEKVPSTLTILKRHNPLFSLSLVPYSSLTKSKSEMSMILVKLQSQRPALSPVARIVP